MRYLPSLDDSLECRFLATTLPVGIVAIMPLDGGTATPPPVPPDPAEGPVNTITGLPSPHPLPVFTPATPGGDPE